MSQRNILMTALSAVALSMLASGAEARSIRLDSGAWDNSGFISTNSTEALGFDFQMLGVSASQAEIATDGSLILSGGTESAVLRPFFDPAQTAGGNTVEYRFGTTNADFMTPGLESGFRIEWQVLDATGALLNEFQVALFELTGGLFSLEFNYNSLTFGDDGSQLGYSTSLGDSFDLAAALGLDFAGYMGVGDDDFVINCDGTPTALACNNYFAGTGDFGPGVNVLPDLANGFYRQIDSNGDPVQGRYLFVFEGATEVPEPATLLLIGLGALLLGTGRHRA